jgi:hypothetical protein
VKTVGAQAAPRERQELAMEIDQRDLAALRDGADGAIERGDPCVGTGITIDRAGRSSAWLFPFRAAFKPQALPAEVAPGSTRFA